MSAKSKFGLNDLICVWSDRSNGLICEFSQMGKNKIFKSRNQKIFRSTLFLLSKWFLIHKDVRAMFKSIAEKTNICKSMMFCWNILLWWKNMVSYIWFWRITWLAEFFVKFSRGFVFANGIYWHFSQSYIFGKKVKNREIREN